MADTTGSAKNLETNLSTAATFAEGLKYQPASAANASKKPQITTTKKAVQTAPNAQNVQARIDFGSVSFMGSDVPLVARFDKPERTGLTRN
jgi:hypothetical protein